MKPYLAAAVCLLLASSSFSSRGVAKSVHPAGAHPVGVRPATFAGDKIPVLVGLGSTLALVIVVK
jgi:hypothetical protein